MANPRAIVATAQRPRPTTDRLPSPRSGRNLLRGTQRLRVAAVGAIVESRELFTEIDLGAFKNELLAADEVNGAFWPLRDRILLLDGLGRLEKNSGDPRLMEERFVAVEKSRTSGSRSGRPKRRPVSRSFEICWAPVSVQEFRLFIDSPDRKADRWWTDFDEDDRLTIADADRSDWMRQVRHPNRPVRSITWAEAVAYCRWRSEVYGGEYQYRLPWVSEYGSIPKKKVRVIKSVELEQVLGALPLPLGVLREANAEQTIEISPELYEWTSNRRKQSGDGRVLSALVGQSKYGRDTGGAFPTEALAPLYVRVGQIGFRLVREPKPRRAIKSASGRASD